MLSVQTIGSHVRRKFYLDPGKCVFGQQESQVCTTILGSCISVIFWHQRTRFFAICHYLAVGGGEQPNEAVERFGRYGKSVLPHMLTLVQQAGIAKSELQVMVVGGASSPNTTGLARQFQIAKRNIEFAHYFLKQHNLPIQFEDTGGEIGRRVSFDCLTGQLDVLLLSG